MALDERLDLYAIKTQFERMTYALDVGALAGDIGFLRRARRALLPLPLIDRREPPDHTRVFPPFRERPFPALAGKRVALVSSGGGGAAVSLVGVARAFEEAGLEPAEIIGCSGGAIWGSMWAAGMSSHEMAEFSLSWTPEDYLDIQWLGLPRFALSALRGFTGLAKGEAIEQLFDARLRALRCADTPIPIKSGYDFSRVCTFWPILAFEVAMAIAKISGNAEIDPRFFAWLSTSAATATSKTSPTTAARAAKRRKRKGIAGAKIRRDASSGATT